MAQFFFFLNKLNSLFLLLLILFIMSPVALNWMMRVSKIEKMNERRRRKKKCLHSIDEN